MSDSRPAVVLVHGLWMRGAEFTALRLRLARAGYATHVFHYRSVRRGLAENAAALAQFVERVPSSTVHLVGHSLGGVLILTALSMRALPRTGRVVCMGSPLTGSGTAAAVERFRLGRHAIGRSMQELLTRGGVGAWRGSVEVGVIAGDFPLGVGSFVRALAGRPNDGTVGVDETRLAGAADHIVLPVSHFSMLWSAEVGRQVVCFLRTGRFGRQPSKTATRS